MRILSLLLLTVSISLFLEAQDLDRKIVFPDVDGYKSLKCDFHIHTVFSDGAVWPNIRVEEALRDGLDAISLTEHIEYQPHSDDIPHPDRNRSYHLALEEVKAHDLLIIHGAEITRSMPPGHANALFIEDANKLVGHDSLTAYREARKQGAFIFWNHPNWMNQQKDAIPVLSDFHRQLINEDLLHGIEVVNDITYSEDALNLANVNDLTVMGTSDIHGLVDYQFEIAKGGHRPICIVLAKEKEEASIKEALFSGRTIAWFENILTGKEPNLRLLVEASLRFKSKGYIGDSDVLQVEVSNLSDATFFLQNTSSYTFYANTDIIEIEPQQKKTLQVLVKKGNVRTTPLTLDVINAITGLKKCLKLSLNLSSL